MPAEKHERHLFWFNLGMDLGLVLSSCFFKDKKNVEDKNAYDEIEAQVQDLKAKIRDGRLGEEEVEEIEDEAETIVGACVKLLGKK